MAANLRRPIQHYTLGDIKDLKLMGYGGQANVYAGKIEVFGQRQMAIKLFNCTSEDQKREIEILIQNPHPNIVKIFGVLCNGTNEPVVWTGYIMEYIGGGSLHDVIYNAKEVYSLPKICIWIVQIAVALGFLHKYKIIHRDIKPENILVAVDQLKLADFGLARNIGATTATWAGTPRYMAPEVHEGKCYLSSDIYSLAITIWEIFHRKRPYQELNDTGSLYSRIISGTRPTIECDKMDGDVAALIQRCWHETRECRPAINEIIDHFQTRVNAPNYQQNVQLTINALLDQGLDVTDLIEQVTQMNALSLRSPIHKIDRLDQKSAQEKTILILGGSNDDSTDDIVLLKENQWIKLSLKLPKKSASLGSVFLNGELYIFGGTLNNRVYKLGKDLKWVRLADMNMKRWCITNSCLEWNGYIWVFGGASDFTATGALKSVERYDPKENKWTGMPSMSHARMGAAVVVWNGKFIICGGFCDTLLKSIECFDPERAVWTKFDGLPTPLNAHALIPYQNRLILLGGWDGCRKLKSVWEWKTFGKRQVWKELPSMENDRSSFPAIILNGEIYVIGGDDRIKSLCETEIFDGERWRKGPDLPQGNSLMSAVAIPQYFTDTLYK